MPRKIDSIQSFELQFDVQLLPRSNESQVVCVQSNFLLSFRARQLLLSGGNIWVVHFSSNYAVSYYIQILYKKHFSAFRLHTSLPNNSPKISTRLYFRRKKCVEKEKSFLQKIVVPVFTLSLQLRWRYFYFYNTALIGRDGVVESALEGHTQCDQMM